MTLQPIGDNLVIRIKDKEKEEVTKNGLILLNQGTQQSLRQDIGEVIAVGDGRVLNNGEVLPFSVKVGEKVLYNKYAGSEVILDTDKYLIIKETDILAIVK